MVLGLIASMLLFTAVSAIAVDSVTDLTEGITAEDLANQLAAGDVSVNAASVTYTGDDRAAGSFAGGADLGLDGGVILGSGLVKEIVVGQNASGLSTALGQPGDAALSALVGGLSTFDAAILEFDFEVGAGADEIFFTYVFGSREFPDFVGSSFNDVFAFWVNDVNCAVTEEGDPIALNNVATAADIAAGTWIDNQTGTHNTEMPGFTIPMLCQAAVTEGTNTIRLAIADASDSVLDSWVLIQAGSLSTVDPGDPDPDPDPDPDMVFQPESVTGTGDNWSAVGKTKNWFQYTSATEGTHDLVQGRKLNNAGDVTITDNLDGTTTLSFSLDDPWELAAVDGNVKIQPLDAQPTAYIPPGRFEFHFTESGSEFSVTVPTASFGYAIHLDAGFWVSV